MKTLKLLKMAMFTRNNGDFKWFFHTVHWIDSTQDVLFLVEESSVVRIHWITHPFRRRAISF